MAAKRSRKVLTFEEKISIVQRLENDERAQDIANHYGIGKSTVHEINRNKKQLFEFCSLSLANEGMTKRRRVMRRPTHENIEKCMHTWYIQERIKGISVTGPMITQKATFFNKVMNGENTSFKASAGWLFRFKQRCGISHLQDELDLNAVMQKDISVFQERLKVLIREKNLTEKQVYYACEVRLSWKSLPPKVAKKIQTDPSDESSNQERLTFLLCINGTGSHKLPLLVIANPGTDTSQTEGVDLPSRLVSTDDACLDPVILKNWFTNGFIPAVKIESVKQGYPPHAVLILESSPAHPFVSDELSTDDGLIQAAFLPPNCTNAKLSLCSGLPEIFKREYRYSQVKKGFGVADDSKADLQEDLLQQYTKTFNLETALQLSVDSWADTKCTDIAKLWDAFFKNLNFRKEDRSLMENEKVETSKLETILSMFHEHEMLKDVDIQDVTDWVEKADSFLLFPILSDEEIMVKVRRELANPIFIPVSEKRKRKPACASDREVIGHLEKCVGWLKNQPNFSADDMKVLRSLQQKARENLKNQEISGDIFDESRSEQSAQEDIGEATVTYGEGQGQGDKNDNVTVGLLTSEQLPNVNI